MTSAQDVHDPERAALRVLVWQRAASLDPAENRAAAAKLPDHIAAHSGPGDGDGIDLVLLPEGVARDFGPRGSDLAPWAEPLDGPFATTLREVATLTGATVAAGMFEVAPDPARPYNTLFLTGPNHEVAYRKIHLFDSFGLRESDLMSAGPIGTTVVPVGGLKVGLQVCYDLRFPELSRALVAAGAEVLLVPAAWLRGPHKLEQWRTLVRARAIENLCWVVAGDQAAPRYCGHSMVVAPSGDIVAEAGPGEEIITATLDRAAVVAARSENPALTTRRM